MLKHIRGRFDQPGASGKVLEFDLYDWIWRHLAFLDLKGAILVRISANGMRSRTIKTLRPSIVLVGEPIACERTH